MNNRELAHRWAQNEGGSGKGSSMFYENGIIYSYGYHFKIAQFYGDIVLFNSDNYSVTTSKHQSYVRQSMTHRTVLTVPNLFDKSLPASNRNQAHKGNVKYFINHVDANIKSLATARKKEYYIGAIQRLINGLIMYVNSMKVPQACLSKRAKDLIKNGYRVDEDMLKKIREAKKTAKIKAEAKARREAKDWINHRNERSFHSSDPVFLRLSELSDKVETSQGVSVPIKEARLLFAVVKRSAINRTSLNAEQLNGCGQIGYYSINRVVNGDITAGCHHIKYQEIEDFAKRVNW